jgi:multidrug efflux pump subunit AcrB
VANPARFAIERPRVVGLAAILMLIYGALSFQGLARQENPTLRERFAKVITYLPGAEPEKVELLITKVIEDHIAEVDDIQDIFTTSTQGVSFMLVELEETAPAAERLQQIREKVQQARGYFPPGASDPEVDTRVFRTNTMVLALFADEGVPGPALRKQAKDLGLALEAMGDVRRVELLGLPEEEIAVDVDLRNLSQRGLPLQHIVDALAARNVELPGGDLEVGALRSTILTGGAFTRPEEVGSTYLGAAPNGLPITLSDVAHIERRPAEPEVRVRYQGTHGVGIAVEMLPRRNAIRMGERVRALLAAYDLPPGMRAAVVADEPTYVSDRLGLLLGSLGMGLALVVAFTLFGMGWRSGLVVSVTIPLALTVAFGFQGIADVALHQISIAALVIAIGIVVDESIVVTDSIQRHLDLGLPPREAAIQGLAEIHLAVLAGAATTVAAFIPLMVMGGDIGQFIRSIPIVVSAMLLGSVLVAHFVTPLLAVTFHHRAGSTSQRLESRLVPFYLPILRFAVERSRVVIGLFAAGIAATLLLVGGALWPPEFFPDADRHQFLINVQLPSGSPLEETEAAIAHIERHLEGDPDLSNWTAFVGSQAPKFYYNEFNDGRARNLAQIVVNTASTVDFDETRSVVDRIDATLEANVPGALIRTRPLRQGYGGGEDVEIYVTGDNLDVLRALSSRIRALVSDLPGVENVRDSFGYDPISLEARIDHAKANLLGISHRDVATVLRTAVDGVDATTFREDDEEIAVRVRLVAGQRRSVADLDALPLFSPTAGRTVPLSQVATFEPGWTNRAILRFDRKREAYVRADVKAGHALLTVAADVERSVREHMSLPPGYHFYFHGQHEEVTESFLSLAKAAVVAVFLIYIILVVRFGSLAQPLLILLAVPMSLVGALWGLAVTGNPLSFMSFLGMISLTGIAVNDSIVLLDAVNRLRHKSGLPLKEAVAQGALTRLRAVLLTSFTTMGGLLPLSLGGGAFWAPFGFAMIFGLGASTILTLVVQPAAYLTLERLRRS